VGFIAIAITLAVDRHDLDVTVVAGACDRGAAERQCPEDD
jgi:hypothetical protein